MYCQTCEIEYKDDSELYNNEYTSGCPMCLLKTSIKQIRKTLREKSRELNKYRICEACQLKFGDCDKNRETCTKVLSELSKL